MFKINQKVVCIDDGARLNTSCRLKKGNIYTILAITRACCNSLCVELKEVNTNGYICTTCGKEHRPGPSLKLAERFEPLKYNSVSQKLASELVEIQETSDMPIKELQV